MSIYNNNRFNNLKVLLSTFFNFCIALMSYNIMINIIIVQPFSYRKTCRLYLSNFITICFPQLRVLPAGTSLSFAIPAFGIHIYIYLHTFIFFSSDTFDDGNMLKKNTCLVKSKYINIIHTIINSFCQ